MQDKAWEAIKMIRGEGSERPENLLYKIIVQESAFRECELVSTWCEKQTKSETETNKIRRIDPFFANRLISELTRQKMKENLSHSVDILQ